MHVYGRKLLFLILLLTYLPWLRAQELAASLTGSFTDSSRATIEGTAIVVKEVGTNGASKTAQTDRSGSYTVTNLAPATYTVTVTAPGFKSFTATNVILFVAQRGTVNAPLQAGSIQGLAQGVAPYNERNLDRTLPPTLLM